MFKSMWPNYEKWWMANIQSLDLKAAFNYHVSLYCLCTVENFGTLDFHSWFLHQRISRKYVLLKIAYYCLFPVEIYRWYSALLPCAFSRLDICGTTVTTTSAAQEVFEVIWDSWVHLLEVYVPLQISMCPYHVYVLLTHCGLVMPFEYINHCRHWLR